MKWQQNYKTHSFWQRKNIVNVGNYYCCCQRQWYYKEIGSLPTQGTGNNIRVKVTTGMRAWAEFWLLGDLLIPLHKHLPFSFLFALYIDRPQNKTQLSIDKYRQRQKESVCVCETEREACHFALPKPSMTPCCLQDEVYTDEPSLQVHLLSRSKYPLSS